MPVYATNLTSPSQQNGLQQLGIYQTLAKFTAHLSYKAIYRLSTDSTSSLYFLSRSEQYAQAAQKHSCLIHSPQVRKQAGISAGPNRHPSHLLFLRLGSQFTQQQLRALRERLGLGNTHTAALGASERCPLPSSLGQYTQSMKCETGAGSQGMAEGHRLATSSPRPSWAGELALKLTGWRVEIRI